MPDTPLPPIAHQTETLARPHRRRRFPWLLLLLALLAAGGGAAWWQGWWPWAAKPEETQAGRGGRGGRFGGPVPVTVVAAARTDIPITLDALGTVQPLATITARAQVDGILVEVAYTEGQEVKRGDVLARIDPRTYQAAMAQAQAKQAQDQALLNNARLDLARYTELSRANGTSRQQLDTQRALVAQYEALVQADQAAVDSARTQLDFTTIRSPVDGRIGLRLVDQGNLVHGSDATGIVVVTQLRPITVVFTLPQQRLGAVLDALGRGAVAVQALEQDGSVRAEGALLTLDNQVDQTTGTIKLKAQFANDDARLWPGAFVNVRMRVATVRQALTIPLVAVQRGPDGAFAFVYKDDNTVEQRPLQLGVVTATEAAVRGGLQEGERVVTSGALRLTPGAQVVLSQPAAPAADAPAPERRRQRPDGAGPRRPQP
jgi:multidrug efflux system membrane fusion protein